MTSSCCKAYERCYISLNIGLAACGALFDEKITSIFNFELRNGLAGGNGIMVFDPSISLRWQSSTYNTLNIHTVRIISVIQYIRLKEASVRQV
jgi:hypothetical protein